MKYCATFEESQKRMADHFTGLSVEARLRDDYERAGRLRNMAVRAVGEAQVRRLEQTNELQFA